jgi:hypothetical protein
VGDNPRAGALLSWRGIILQLAYRLRRHFLGGWSMGGWLGVLLHPAVASVLIGSRSADWPLAAALGALFLVYGGILVWARRHRTIYFAPGEVLPDDPLSAAGLEMAEMIPIRASGWFTVEGKRQYYVDLDADYQTVPSREHTILARV